MFGLRKIKDEDNFIHKFENDLKKNNMTINLVISVYTNTLERFDKIVKKAKSYTIKLNKPSSEMNLYLEHQGKYLIKEFMNMKLVEMK